MKANLRLVTVAMIGLAVSANAYAKGPKTYPSEEAATKACRSEVVWANTDSGVFHVKGTRWYGTTKEGAWVCRAAAEKAKMHAAKNDQ